MTMAQHSQALEREAPADRLVPPALVARAARAVPAPGARQGKAVALEALREALALAAEAAKVALAAEAAKVARAAQAAEVARAAQAAPAAHLEPARSTAEGIQTVRVLSCSRAAHTRKAR
jgi:fused signal recognition particle receptor